MKRILTIQDISCVGKCSLTVALPIISSYGIEASILPTAVLSTHTAFNSFTFHDLTDEITPIASVWKSEGIEFDGLYTGYLGSKRQIDLVLRLFRDFGNRKIKFVDPAMGDNGSLYKGFNKDFAHEMAKLCSAADIIVPNLTEACFMLDKPYIPSGYSEDYVKELLTSLVGLGCKRVVLTGVGFSSDELGCYGYDAEKREFFSHFNKRNKQSFHGTGDVFASVFAGAVVRGKTALEAASLAADIVCEAIRVTDDDHWYGVSFEKAIPALVKAFCRV